jgi:thiol-disulfide isomerase/thioredoxin
MNRREALAASAALAGILGAGPSTAAVPGDRVAWPDGVTLLDGSLWAPRAGHAQVIVRWATWCGYCRRHNAHVDTLWRSLGDAPLQVLGVAADRDAAAVRRHQQTLGHGFPVTLDSSAFASLSARRLIPLTITVDRAGRLREIIPGEMTADDVMGLAALAR